MAFVSRFNLKSIYLLLFVFLVGYLLGGVTVYKNFFPFDQVRDLKNIIIGNDEYPPNPFWPERRQQFEMFYRPAEIVMIGDSITHAGHWEDIFPERSIANRGIGSDRTDDILRRINSIVSIRPKRAFLMIGTNDFLAGKSVDKVFGDYKKIVSVLREYRIEVFIQSTVECSVDICGDRLEKIRELNTLLASYAKSEGLIYVDLNNGITTVEDGLLGEFSYDGIHLLGKGYSHWAGVIRPYIAN